MDGKIIILEASRARTRWDIEYEIPSPGKFGTYTELTFDGVFRRLRAVVDTDQDMIFGALILFIAGVACHFTVNQTPNRTTANPIPRVQSSGRRDAPSQPY